MGDNLHNEVGWTEDKLVVDESVEPGAEVVVVERLVVIAVVDELLVCDSVVADELVVAGAVIEVGFVVMYGVMVDELLVLDVAAVIDDDDGDASISAASTLETVAAP